MRTHNIPSYKRKLQKNIHIMPPDLALCFTLTSSNYPCLEYIFMVPKVFEFAVCRMTVNTRANKRNANNKNKALCYLETS